ncbi:MAG: cytochrome c4 [Gammaproteobacteria bacterium]|nr:cytochrome c4 [Gammaproteobacteria bacterium]MCW8922649.1 cytochrome c4 [Gammaproteobacteria bacterium]
MKKIIVSSAVLLLSLAGVVHAAGDAAAGKEKAVACGACHGADGNSMVPTFPNLAGQSEKYIVKQIADFKAKATRQDPVMEPQVAALSDQDAQDIAAFFVSQKLVSTATADESKLAMGREIYKGGNLQTGVPACQGCHGPTGAGNPGAGYPQLTGQHAMYTIKQLVAFKDGSRSNDDRKVMRNVMAGMTEAEIEAVAQYIASLR